jgi:ubiquinone/menaquinone biosynthesis C-methylase UbiE
MPTQQAFWDRVARKYAARPIRDMAAYDATMVRTRAHLHPGDRALELGCGTGTTALRLAPHLAHLTATDISGEMLAIAREKAARAGAENLAFAQATVSAAPTGPAPGYDVVLAYNFLQLIADIPQTLARVHDLLAPGGRFISKTVCLGRHAWHLRAVVALLRAVGKAPPLRFLSAEELEAMIRAAGFEILETGDYPARPRSRFVVARKPANVPPRA